MAKICLSAIGIVLCASFPPHSIFSVVLPHSEVTITVYVDVVASALIILKASNSNVTSIPYFNASAVCFTICIDFSVVLGP